MTQHAQEMRNRFGLGNGAVWASNIYKNLWWEVNGEFFGYGDLNAADVFRIQENLRGDEIFQGWNEHHMSRWQQRSTPMIRIKRDEIIMGVDLIAEEDRLTELDHLRMRRDSDEVKMRNWHNR
jgi:hypothetical protein